MIVTITKNDPKSGLLYHWYMFEFHVDINYIYLYLISISIYNIYIYISIYEYLICIYIYYIIYPVYHISLETTWILLSFLAPFIDFLPGLHEAVAADSIEAAKYLLAHGCLLNATDSMQDELLDAKPRCPLEIIGLNGPWLPSFSRAK